ncbi:hypothetical protein J3A83DRAFT_113940 [Scleroderma citrinum]
MDLCKLTVPQLKALCKERRIVGYSKLGKAALVQKLNGVDTKSGESPRQPSSSQSTIVDNDTTQSAGNPESCSTRDLPKVDPNHLPLSSNPAPGRKTPPDSIPNKRPTHIGFPPVQKRVKTAQPHQVGAHRSNHSDSPTHFVLTTAINDGFKVPAVPDRLLITANPGLQENPLRGSTTTSRRGFPTPKNASGRFRPLTVSNPQVGKPCHPEHLREAVLLPEGNSLTTLGFTPGMAFPSPPSTPSSLSFVNISLPPSIPERRRVHKWAVILCGLDDPERQACCLVSRVFRYAIYLSAVYILEKKHHGRRLDAVFKQYPRHTTNMWPYLRFRDREVVERRQAFSQSFLGRYTRYVLTRMWFAVSVGMYGHDASAWKTSRIVDVQEIVSGEVWQVRTQREGATETFYVLEATCEVIGHPSSSASSEKVNQGTLRADWSVYISSQLSGASSAKPTKPCLLDYVRWSDVEDYELGISKLWLHHVSKDSELGDAKRCVAERYILACVVANGISGQWMSTNLMAQDFAGLPESSTNAIVPSSKAPSINMYLPSHHYVESVHFTGRRNEELHPALAVVQTPSREYYILKDNGMQVGCEEEGVADVWMQILGCDNQGHVV